MLANHEPLLRWYFSAFYERVFYEAEPGMRLDRRMKELLRLGLSKKHGYTFCNRVNSHEALAIGLSQEQIEALQSGSPPGFDDQATAVIDLADQMLLHNDAGQLDAALYARLRRWFDDSAIIEIGVIAAVLTGFAKLMFVYDLVDREDTYPLGPVAGR